MNKKTAGLNPPAEKIEKVEIQKVEIPGVLEFFSDLEDVKRTSFCEVLEKKVCPHISFFFISYTDEEEGKWRLYYEGNAYLKCEVCNKIFKVIYLEH